MNLSDEEIKWLCAEAMEVDFGPELVAYTVGQQMNNEQIMANRIAAYDPLHDDAQAMALVKKFRLTIYGHNRTEDEWAVFTGWRDSNYPASAQGNDLNRAICEFVAKMQLEKGSA